MTKGYVGVKEVAERFGVSATTVKRLAQDGKIPPPAKIGRALCWDLEELERGLAKIGKEWLMQRTYPPLGRTEGGADKPLPDFTPAELKRIRERFCLVQREVAELVGCDPWHIYRAELSNQRTSYHEDIVRLYMELGADKINGCLVFRRKRHDAINV